jgi:hypothetical protein
MNISSGRTWQIRTVPTHQSVGITPTSALSKPGGIAVSTHSFHSNRTKRLALAKSSYK